MKFFDRKLVTLLLVLIATAVTMLSLVHQPTLDAKFYYTAAEARELLAALGAQQRDSYFNNELLDLLFLSTYTALLGLSLKRVWPKNLWIMVLAATPGANDFVETSSIIYALKFREPPEVFAWLGVVTCLKWSFAGLALMALVLGALKRKAY